MGRSAICNNSCEQQKHGFGFCFLDIFSENRQNFLRSRLRRSRFYFYFFWWEGARAKIKGSRGRSFGALFVLGVRQPFGDIFKGFDRSFSRKSQKVSTVTKGSGCCFWGRMFSKTKNSSPGGGGLHLGWAQIHRRKRKALGQEVKPSPFQNPLYFLEIYYAIAKHLRGSRVNDCF